MREREKLVRALVSFSEPVSSLIQEIKKYDWDCEQELISLKPEHIQNVLSLYLSGDISEAEVCVWANAIERREDICLLESHKEILDEMVFWLANPEINFPITHKLAKHIISNLQKNIID